MTTTENRALSVSYGSFSVKLEGFDEPFSIMRRITEYFRSIAAVDPTFGQKPLIEDLSALEAIETAVFNDDVSLTTNGSTITLSPKELEEPRDVFVLGNTDLAPAQDPIDEFDETPDTIVDMTAEQQIALANTPLDLREMAQNHQEMPFVGNGPQALDDTALEQPVETVEPETPAEQPITETQNTTTPQYRSLNLAELDSAQADEPEIVLSQTDMDADMTAVMDDTTDQETQGAPIEDAIADDTSEPVVDLRDQKPIEKRPLRIIRSEYAYEEPEQLETPTKAPEAPSVSVNPFRKFPKRDAPVAPAEIAPTKVEPAQEAETDTDDDFIITYRKLRAEHG
jgi:hypothetical protein